MKSCGKHCIIGLGTRFNAPKYVSLGNNVKIGANAIVLKDVPDNTTIVGVPGEFTH